MSAINSSAFANLLASLKAPQANLNPVAAQQAANNANSLRGQSILNLLSGQGQAQLTQNQLGYQNQLGNIAQQDASKGLTNTTVGANLGQGALNNLNQSNELVNQNTAMNVANMANSFSQNGPNMGLLAQLLSNGGGTRIGTPATPSIGNTINPASMLDSSQSSNNNSLNTPAPSAQFFGPSGINNSNYPATDPAAVSGPTATNPWGLPAQPSPWALTPQMQADNPYAMLLSNTMNPDPSQNQDQWNSNFSALLGG